MPNDIDTREEAVNNVLNGLQWLIINHSHAAAREQYIPRESADASDELIKDHKEWVEKLRKIRGEFEDLTTGLL